MAASIQVTYQDTIYEIFPSEQVPIRLNLSNIENTQIGDFHGSLSQSFRIPGSAVNNRFFNFLFSTVTGTGPGFNTSIPCVVKNEGQILFSGELSVDEIVDNDGDIEYVVSIEDRTLSINDLLSGHRVIDLDSSGLVHEYSGESVVASWRFDGEVDFRRGETGSTGPTGTMCGTWTLPANDETTVWRYLDCMGLLQITTTSGMVEETVQGLNSFEPIPFVFSGFDSTPVIDLIPTFSAGTTSTTTSFGDEAVTSGRVFYPLIDQGTDGVIEDQDFGYISSSPTTITSNTASGGSWSSGEGMTGLSSLDSFLRTEQLTPAISVPVIIDKIFQQADPNITWESEFVDRFLTDAYILPKSYDGLGIVTDSNLAVHGFRSGVDTSLRTFEYDGTAATNNEIRSRRQITNIPINTGGAAFNGSRFTFPIGGTYELTFGFTVASFDRSGLSGGAAGQFHDVRFNIEIYDGAGNRQDPGINLEENPVQFRLADSGSTTSIELGDYEATTRANVQSGWYAEVYTEGYRNKGNRDVFVTITNVSFGTDEEPLVWDGASCNPLQQFDNDLLSIDLMTAILRQFNLVLVPVEEREKHYEIIQYNDWIRTGTTRDWSYKLDRSQGISIIPLISEQSKTITFVGAEEDDPFSVASRNQSPRRELGSRIYPNQELDGEINTSKAEGDEIIGEFFSPIAIGSISGADQTAQPTANTGDIVHTYVHNNGTKETVVFAPKIGFRSPIIPSSGIIGTPINESRMDGSTVVARYIRITSHRTLTPYITLPGFTRDDLISTNWSTRSDYPGYNPGTHEGCYDAFWKDYVDNLYREDNIKFTGSFYFAPHEITSLRLNDPIYLDGQAYLINRINGFNLTEPDTVEVELIRYYGDLPTFAEPNPDIPANTISIVSDIGGSDAVINIDVGDDVVFTATTLPSSLDNIWCRDGVQIITTRGFNSSIETLVVEGKSTLLQDAQLDSTGVYIAKLLDGTESNSITVIVGDAAVQFPDDWCFEAPTSDSQTQTTTTVNAIGAVSDVNNLPSWLELTTIGSSTASGGISTQDITLTTTQTYVPGYEGTVSNGERIVSTRTHNVNFVTGTTNTPVQVTQYWGPHVFRFVESSGVFRENTKTAFFNAFRGEECDGTRLSPNVRFEVSNQSVSGLVDTDDLFYRNSIGTNSEYSSGDVEQLFLSNTSGAILYPNFLASYDVTFDLTVINDDYPMNRLTLNVTSDAGTPTLEIDPTARTVGSSAGTVDITVTAFSADRWTFAESADWFSAERIDDTTLRVTYTENTGSSSRNSDVVFTHTDNSALTRTFTLTQLDNFDIQLTPAVSNVSNAAGSVTFTGTAEGGTSRFARTSTATSTFASGSTFVFNYEANTGPARTFTVNIYHADDRNLIATATINQAAGDPTIEWRDDLTEITYNQNSVGNTITTLPDADDWVRFPTSDAAWLRFDRLIPGGIPRTISFDVDTNNGTESRMATVTAVHRDNSSVTDTWTVVQNANANNIEGPDELDFGPYDPNRDPDSSDNEICQTVSVTVPHAGTYTISESCDWVTISRSVWTVTRAGQVISFDVCVDENSSSSERTCTITVEHPTDSTRNLQIEVTQGESEDPSITSYLAGYEEDPIDDILFELNLTNAQVSAVTSVVFEYGIGNYDNSITASTSDIGNTRQYTARVEDPPVGVYQTRAVITHGSGTTNSQEVTVTVE